jgi:copper chaperone NosL
MRRVALPLTLLCLALISCGRDEQIAAVPREPTANATGYYCGMALKEHKGPKGQILLRGMNEPLWFPSVREALNYVEQDLTNERELAGFWVNDMAQGTWETPAPGSWIDARTAWFVIGSRKAATMGGDEAIPFKDRIAAEDFVKDQGGRVTDYNSARREIINAPMADGTTGGGG